MNTVTADNLDIDDVRVAYGKAQVLFGVSARVDAGECVAVLGANGAGKTTLLRTVSRILPLRGGDIRLGGRPLNRLSPQHVFRLGVSHVPEGRGLFPSLTVADNILLGAFQQPDRQARARMAELAPMFPELRARYADLAGKLSGGQQQMVAIVRALMSRPSVLLLDEPTLGLSPVLRQQVLASIKDVAATGVGVLIVEQNARQVLEISQRCYVMRNGKVTYQAKAADALTNYARLSDEYLGTHATTTKEEG